MGYSPWGPKESDVTEHTLMHICTHESISQETPAIASSRQKFEMATHSSVLAWRIPGMGEPGGLPSMGSHRVRHD